MANDALSDVTLTMIVRDELMNCAGGLSAVLDRHILYFPETVVVDTGSVDGTKELLAHTQERYPILRVF